MNGRREGSWAGERRRKGKGAYRQINVAGKVMSWLF
jgi:hypothetical protein